MKAFRDVSHQRIAACTMYSHNDADEKRTSSAQSHEDVETTSQSVGYMDDMSTFFRQGTVTESKDIPAQYNEEAQEFDLILLFEPQNVRHKIVVTASTTLQELRLVIKKDLRIREQALTFPTLGVSDANNDGFASRDLQSFGICRPEAGQREHILPIHVDRKPDDDGKCEGMLNCKSNVDQSD